MPVEVSINYVRFDDEEYAIGFARDISERKRSEDALRLTQFSVDTAADPIVWIKPDGRFAYANMAAAKHFGYAPDELLKLTIADINRGISINSWKDLFHRLKRKRTQMREYEHLTRDGRMVPVEITDNYIKFGDAEYVLSSIRDINERKRHETELKESEARYRRLIDQAPDAILIVDDKQILFANPAAASLLGYRRPQLIMERTPFDIVEPDVRNDAIRRTRGLLTRSESVAVTEQRLLKRDGTTVEVEVTGSPTRWLGRAAGQFIIRDITERKRTENALRMTQFAIDNSSDGITWLDRKGNFSYVNHAMAKLLGYSIEELLKMRRQT